jgi:hypothetical protein
MRRYKFKISTDAGVTTYICASCRTEAIEIYQQQTGVPIDYIKEHCLIKNLGIIDWVLGKEKENG